MTPTFYSGYDSRLLSTDVVNGIYEGGKIVGAALITAAFASKSWNLTPGEKAFVVISCSLPILAMWGLSYHATNSAQIVLEASGDLQPAEWKCYKITGLRSSKDVHVVIFKVAMMMIALGFTLMIIARVEPTPNVAGAGMLMFAGGGFLGALTAGFMYQQQSGEKSEKIPLVSSPAIPFNGPTRAKDLDDSNIGL